MSPRWQKVIRELTSNLPRTLLTVTAIAVGVFAFGSVFISQELLLKNIDLQYRQSHASTITLYLSGFDDSLVNWVRSEPDIADAQGFAAADIKVIFSDGRKLNLNLTSVPDYRSQRLNLLSDHIGSWPPQSGEIVFERTSLSGGKFRLGDDARLEIADNKYKDLKVAGSVYQNSGFPFMFTQTLSGFVSWDTLGFLGFPKNYNRLDIAPGPAIKTLADAEKLTFNLTEKFKDRGLEVRGSQVFKPNQHWATDNSRAFTAILSVIGIFSLILSGFLVINTISALLSQQRRQIGIMKAIGAGGSQVIALYLSMVAAYGLLALLIALPVGMALGFGFLKLVSNFLNLNIQVFYLPPMVFLMELAAALIIPLISAVIPIFQSSKTSIRSALTDFQVNSRPGRVDQFINTLSIFSRPTLISFRNIFRKKGRLLLTLGTLTTAGALFMAVLNVQSGMYREMDRILSMFDFEISLGLRDDYNVAAVNTRLMEIPRISAIEGRTGVGARLLKSDGSKGSPFSISGLPPSTPFSRPIILSGRWLADSDTDQVVLSSSLVRDNPGLSVGQNITVEINNDQHRFEIVGVVAMAGDQKLGFAPFHTVASIKDKPGLASSFMVKTSPSDASTQDSVAVEIENRLRRSGILVVNKETKNQIYSGAANQFNFMVFFLLAMAVMVAIVGGLGLAGTMSLNVLERTREIGIMRSIGADDGAIRKLVLVEGLLVGLLSLLLAVPFSLPLTYGFCYAIGNAFFSRTLVFVLVPKGIIIWLLIIVAISVIACLIPARRASRLRISETLSYE